MVDLPYAFHFRFLCRFRTCYLYWSKCRAGFRSISVLDLRVLQYQFFMGKVIKFSEASEALLHVEEDFHFDFHFDFDFQALLRDLDLDS